MTNVRSTNKKEDVETLNVGYSSIALTVPIAASGSVVTYLYPPVGRIEKISQVSMYIAPVGGATLGSHVIILGDGTAVGFLFGQQVFNGLMYYDYGEWNVAITIERPPDATSQALMLHSIIISNALPLKITYNNSTDGIQIVAPLIDIRTQVVNEW